MSSSQSNTSSFAPAPEQVQNRSIDNNNSNDEAHNEESQDKYLVAGGWGGCYPGMMGYGGLGGYGFGGYGLGGYSLGGYGGYYGGSVLGYGYPVAYGGYGGLYGGYGYPGTVVSYW